MAFMNRITPDYSSLDKLLKTIERLFDVRGGDYLLDGSVVFYSTSTEEDTYDPKSATLLTEERDGGLLAKLCADTCTGLSKLVQPQWGPRREMAFHYMEDKAFGAPTITYRGDEDIQIIEIKSRKYMVVFHHRDRYDELWVQCLSLLVK